jgi:hypothetical protein
VVVDTDSSFVYLGTLKAVREHFLDLADADAHDRGDGTSTKEKYIMDVKRFGVRANRREVSVRKETVVSLSLLEDVVEY